MSLLSKQQDLNYQLSKLCPVRKFHLQMKVMKVSKVNWKDKASPKHAFI